MAQKYIGVFCSAYDVEEKYVQAAREFATSMTKQGYHLVFGGSNTGIMKVVADTVQSNGGKLVGITIEIYKDKCRENLDEKFIAPSLSERKSGFLAKADAFAVLVGGLGTLDELTEIIELKKQQVHNKPVVFLNTDGFYTGFKMQLDRMEQENFIPVKFSEFAHFANTPQDAIDYLHAALQK